MSLDHATELQVESWLRPFAESTRDSYRRTVEQFGRWCVEREVVLLEAESEHVVEFLRQLAGETARATVKLRASALGSFYRHLGRQRVRSDDPSLGVHQRLDLSARVSVDPAMPLDGDARARVRAAGAELGPEASLIICLLDETGMSRKAVSRVAASDFGWIDGRLVVVTGRTVRSLRPRFLSDQATAAAVALADRQPRLLSPETKNPNPRLIRKTLEAAAERACVVTDDLAAALRRGLDLRQTAFWMGQPWQYPDAPAAQAGALMSEVRRLG